MSVPPSHPAPRGLVLDDHTYMRAAMRTCLHAVGVEAVSEVSTLAEARTDLREGAPLAIAVVDLRLADGSGLDLITELRTVGTPVVVYTSADDGYSVRTAYAAGAAGYVLKSATVDVVRAALKDVLAGRVHVDPDVAGLLVSGVQRIPTQGKVALTAREIAMLQLAAEGMTNAEIAERLKLTPLAVKGQFVRIGRKLGARDRTQMVAEAMRADLVR